MGIDIVTKDDLMLLESSLINSFKQLFYENSKNQTKRWLKTKELEELYGVSLGKQQKLRNERKIPFTKLGDTIYYSIEDIDKILEANKTTV